MLRPETLFLVALFNRIFRIRQLLASGMDINSCDGGSANNSVLHWAVSFADLPTVKLVIGKCVF